MECLTIDNIYGMVVYPISLERTVQPGATKGGSSALSSRIASFMALQIMDFGTLAFLPVREGRLGDLGMGASG